MNTIDKKRTRLFFLGILILVLVLTYIFSTWLYPTLSRYIKREQDEIRAHYSALYFASTGDNKTVALENSIGYVDFDLRNYIGENVTQRDIVYSISKPTVFYRSDGSEINEADIPSYLATPGNKLHVLDVWNNPQPVADSTYLYDVEIVKNNGEIISEGVYTFTHEKLATGSKGKVHSLTCKVTAADGYEPTTDEISLVVQLTKPYKEVLIINMKVSNLLITFSQKDIKVFDVPVNKLYIQTVDLFGRLKDDDGEFQNNPNRVQIIDEVTNTYYKYTPYAMKLTLYWNGYLLDETALENIHIGTSSKPGDIKDYDTVDPNGNPNDIGTIPNPNVNSPYIDVKKPTIARLNSLYDETNNSHRGEMVLFVPQGTDIYLHFLKAAGAASGSIDVKIEAYVEYYENGVLNVNKSGYEIYSYEVFGGYKHTRVDGEDLYNLFKYPNN